MRRGIIAKLTASLALMMGFLTPLARAQNDVPRPSSQMSQGSAASSTPGQPGNAGGATTPGNTTPGSSNGTTGDGTSAGTPGAGATPGAGTTPGAGAGGASDAIGTAPASGLGGGPSGNSGSLFGNMLGDQPPLSVYHVFQTRPPGVPKPPGIPGVPILPPQVNGNNRRAVAVIPSVRGFKIADNQSPQPQDRIYSSFNYYDNLNYQVNSRLNTPVSDFQVYRYIIGFEKTVLNGQGSVGMRLPIDNLSTNSRIPGLGGTSTSTGDLAAIFKYALINDPAAGRILSVGTVVSMPTGPNSFAGAKGFRSAHNTALQPYVGFLRSFGDFYVQGFSSVDVPFSPHDVTIFYNDVGVGYYVYRAENLDQLITAIAPTVELHVNTPLNHTNPYITSDRAGSYDIVDFTFGTNFQIRRKGLLSLGINEPVTGPRPYRIEAIAQFNLRF